eukprot:s4964_g7.t1
MHIGDCDSLANPAESQRLAQFGCCCIPFKAVTTSRYSGAVRHSGARKVGTGTLVCVDLLTLGLEMLAVDHDRHPRSLLVASSCFVVLRAAGWTLSTHRSDNGLAREKRPLEQLREGTVFPASSKTRATTDGA